MRLLPRSWVVIRSTDLNLTSNRWRAGIREHLKPKTMFTVKSYISRTRVRDQTGLGDPWVFGSSSRWFITSTISWGSMSEMSISSESSFQTPIPWTTLEDATDSSIFNCCGSGSDWLTKSLTVNRWDCSCL